MKRFFVGVLGFAGALAAQAQSVPGTVFAPTSPVGVTTTVAAAATTIANVPPIVLAWGDADLPFDGIAANFGGAPATISTAFLPPIAFLPPAGSAAPAITSQPAAQNVLTGTAVTLSVAATGSPAPTYLWLKNGVPISKASGASYSIPAAQLADAGSYQVVVFNLAGLISSNAVTVSVANAGTVTTPPTSQSVATGSTATFSVVASPGLTYQWQFGGANVTAATTAALKLVTVGPTAAGTYLVKVSNGATVVAEEAATLAVTTNARLTNLSVRGKVSASQDLAVGFVVSGAATKQLLIRGVGPTLSNFSVSDPLATPKLTLYGSFNKVVATNSAWGGGTSLSAVFSQVGAFALPATSADAALLEPLGSGNYTAHISSVGTASGVALAELYDADTGVPASTLVNISGSAVVADGSDVLAAGFVVAGPTSEEVLIRGIGPGLSSVFGLHGTLPSTSVTLYDSKGNAVLSNANWNDNPAIIFAGGWAGAFPLPLHSLDSAMLVTLAPGAYTAQVTGPATGLGMVEIYEIK